MIRRRSLLIANALAREAAYRALRKLGSQPRLSPRAMLLKGEVSVVKVNALPALVFAALGAASSMSYVVSPSAFTAASAVLTAIVLEAFVAIGSVVSFTSSFLEHGLATLLNLYPLSTRETLESFTLAAVLYYGCLASLAAPVAAAALLAARGSPALALTLTLAAVALLVASPAIGMFLGSLSPRRLPARVLAALAAALVFAAIYAVLLIGMNSAGASELWAPPQWLALVPFLGFAALPLAHSPLYALTSATSTVLGVAASAALGLLGAKRVVEERVHAAQTQGPAERRLRIVVASYYAAQLVKDLKCLSRSTRRLSAALYFAVGMPLILMFMFIGPRGAWRSLVHALACVVLVGLAVGLGGGACTEQLYYLEGEGGKAYYALPVTRKRIAVGKALGGVALMLPGCAIVAAAAFHVLGAQAAASVALVGLSSSALAAAVISKHLASSLPSEPCAWNEMIVGKSSSLVVALAILTAIGVITGFAVAVTLAFRLPLATIALLSSSLMLLLAASTLNRVPGDPL